METGLAHEEARTISIRTVGGMERASRVDPTMLLHSEYSVPATVSAAGIAGSATYGPDR
jgi:hypothetical protein